MDSKTALFIIDVQNALASTPATRVPHAERLTTVLQEILSTARSLPGPKNPTHTPIIVFVQHSQPPKDGALVKGTEPWQLVFEPDQSNPNEMLVHKTTGLFYSCTLNLVKINYCVSLLVFKYSFTKVTLSSRIPTSLISSRHRELRMSSLWASKVSAACRRPRWELLQLGLMSQFSRTHTLRTMPVMRPRWRLKRKLKSSFGAEVARACRTRLLWRSGRPLLPYANDISSFIQPNGGIAFTDESLHKNIYII